MGAEWVFRSTGGIADTSLLSLGAPFPWNVVTESRASGLAPGGSAKLIHVARLASIQVPHAHQCEGWVGRVYGLVTLTLGQMLPELRLLLPASRQRLWHVLPTCAL